MFLISSALCQKSNEKPLRLAEKKEYNEKNGCVKYGFFSWPKVLIEIIVKKIISRKSLNMILLLISNLHSHKVNKYIYTQVSFFFSIY